MIYGRRILIVSLVWFVTISALSQEKGSFENLSIDRPDISNLPVTVRPGHYQVEMGAEFGRNRYVREHHLPDFLLRTGINKKSEFRLGITSLYLDSLKNPGKEKILVASISGKYRLVEEKNGRPAIAIQPELTLPFGHGVDVHRDEANFTLMNYSMILLFNNTLHEKVFLNYNAGVFWNNHSEFDYLFSVSTSFAHTHKLGYFLESYSFFNNDHFPISIDGGATYLLHPRLQVDIYAGNRQILFDRYWFYGFGIGFRIDRDDLRRETFEKTGIHH